MLSLNSAEPVPLALRRLIWMRNAAKLARLRRRLLSPRRLLFTSVAVVLGLLWLSQILIAVAFREPADPQRLRSWITGGLLLYAFWHLLKTAWEEPRGIQWTDGERELLWTAPLSDRHLLAYRLADLAGPAIIKATLLALFMLPESTRPELTWVGILIALVMLELTRMAAEIFVWGISVSIRRKLKIVVSAVAVAILVSVSSYAWLGGSNGPPTLPMMAAPQRLLSGLEELGSTTLVQIAGWPLSFLADVATSSTWSLGTATSLSIGLVELAGLTWLIFWLHRKMSASRIRIEWMQYARQLRTGLPQPKPDEDTRSLLASRSRLAGPCGLSGIGAITARQFVTIRRYWLVTLITLMMPTVLAMVPLFIVTDRQTILVHVIASLVFYTLLLGPPALKIDFRRDLDRMMLLRQLPMTPVRQVIGNLILPVIVCCGVQVLTLLAMAPVVPWGVADLTFAVSVLFPATVIIFALENAIFLAYPERDGQEGIEVLLRSLLVFTCKGLLFGVALACVLVWSMLVAQLPQSYQPGVFTLSAVGAMWSLTIGMVLGTSYVFRRFDTAFDVPPA